MQRIVFSRDGKFQRLVERDLRSHYGAQYRVLASDSPEQAYF